MLRRPLRRPLGLALCCAAALAGCGGGGEPDAGPTPTPTTATAAPTATSTPTPTPSPSPTGAAADPPVLPTFVRGAIGQEAFATYVVQAWTYALSSNDAAPLVDRSVGRKRACQGCPELVKELEQRSDEGWSVFPFEVTIEEIRLIESARGVTARVVFDVPETRSYFDDGSLRNANPAHDDSTFTISMRVEKREYRLIGFTISEAKGTG